MSKTPDYLLSLGADEMKQATEQEYEECLSIFHRHFGVLIRYTEVKGLERKGLLSENIKH